MSSPATNSSATSSPAAGRGGCGSAWPGLGGLIGLVLLTITACGVPIGNDTHHIADGDVPYELLEVSATTTTTTTAAPGGSTTTVQTESVPLYFVRDERIERRVRTVPSLVGIAERLAMLAEPLVPREAEAGFRSAVPPGSFTATEPQLRGGVVTVDLSPEFTSVPAREQVFAFAQITFTLTDLPGVGQLIFTLNGSPISALDQDGVAVPGAVTEDTYSALYAS